MQLCAIMASFESQLASILDKKKASLTKVKELEEVLVAEKERTNYLEGELSIAHVDFDIKRGAQI